MGYIVLVAAIGLGGFWAVKKAPNFLRKVKS
jgi:hypothetical protein